MPEEPPTKKNPKRSFAISREAPLWSHGSQNVQSQRQRRCSSLKKPSWRYASSTSVFCNNEKGSLISQTDYCLVQILYNFQNWWVKYVVVISFPFLYSRLTIPSIILREVNSSTSTPAFFYFCYHCCVSASRIWW